MNELSDLRALHTDAPLPDTARLAPARVRLTQAFRQETAADPAPVRPPRRTRRTFLVTAAATGALAVTGGIVVSLPDGAAPADGGLLSAQASAAALELAATTVEKQAVTEPGPKQWVYEKSMSFTQGKPQTSEEWTRWDGTGHANLPGLPGEGDMSDFDPNKLQVWYGPNQEEKWAKEGYDDRSQRQFWRFLSTLPSDPDRMMKRIREEHAIGDIKGETRAERDWREINVLYRSVLLPSHVQAGLFRALAKIPGARVEKGVKDPLGRAAIGVSVNYAKPSAAGWQGKQELFFDPKTYAYLGEKQRTRPAGPSKEESRGSGEVTFAPLPASNAVITARLGWGVVDKPGARP
ncbi:CU044_5270 family protein [Streptomyces sp. CC219B]|uniref:CU044_5270 family protein n=1 Tax=Streptomyces sp. CC219B TaxID=3044574 RepID=UPI0024A89E09|nr:CU044_5270 family protein [Streptomyces sp. CC219B]